MDERRRWKIDLVVDDEPVSVYTCTNGEPGEATFDTIKALVRWTRPVDERPAEEG
jgi:hypothetical protein